MATDDIVVQVDGRPVAVAQGASVIAALVLADSLCTRRSVRGEARFALCGMGYCQECRVSIDGRPHRLACQSACRAGMVIVTGAGSGT
ncbi:2Fe-2S iron-sulfur cluster-binding protein [Massilia sp. DJPM01]|uniref:2Fe-2S iron-sulfur cluster-binding protein n=1 Tax=Massilia sp. DJPM01 TaxID=3024404 RepID=UPI00259FB337|nr:2Fe-2S iron-sulfur cluster-binding protein [Massilia sp. DJPM01]MDM5181865.1 2Fe-2S iron-sulfur cluster-binding protein [Massilia sp. DJPM01]